jgi:hypothetical protein
MAEVAAAPPMKLLLPEMSLNLLIGLVDFHIAYLHLFAYNYITIYTYIFVVLNTS